MFLLPKPQPFRRIAAGATACREDSNCYPLPRRSKVRFAPTSFYAWGKKDVIRPLTLLLLALNGDNFYFLPENQPVC